MRKETLNLKSVHPDKVVSVNIGGMFYQRLNKLVLDFGDLKGSKELLKAMYDMQNNQVAEDDAYAFNLETLIILVQTIEQAFEDAGYMNEGQVEVEVPEDFHISKVIKK
jgi:hypothetical protein